MVLPSNRYLYYVASGDNPKQAFQTMTEEIEMWNSYDNSPSSFQPKKFTIVSSPQNPLRQDQVQNFITSNEINIRNNYAGCIFLEDSKYLFYMEKNNG